MPEDAARIAINAVLGDPEARLAMALDVQAMAMFDWDLVTGKIDWPAGAAKMFGLSEGSIFDWRSWTQYVSAEDEARVALTAMQAERDQAPTFRFHYRLQSDEWSRSIEGTAKCIYDGDGKLVRAIGINMDVTERDQREQELRARQSQLQSILATVPDAMITIDEHGIVQQFSRAAEVMLGYRASEVIGANISVLMPSELAVEHDSYIDHYLKTGERQVIGRQRLLSARRRDGSLIPIELSVGEAFSGTQRIFTGFIRDMSDRLRAERESSELLSQLAQVDRSAAMGELAAGLAHEVNQPLSASSNYLAAAKLLLKKQTSSSGVEELLESATKEIHRAGNIIRNLRQFVARREIDIRVEPIEPTIREAVNLVLVGDARLAVHVHYEFLQSSTHMIADRIQIQQVLVNLIRNAAEIERDHGVKKEIWIRVRSIDDGLLQFSIQDNGVGIKSGQIDNLFTDGFSTKSDENMGLGLSICRRIITAHGGHIEASNADEGGAVFSFTIQSACKIELG